ncbi:N-acetylmuramoyl-L-alanine amidase family protein [Alloscardovia criceti]|uniref:N-acetylmuramoyl-L-alanine amidase family protein n=1 Tax=Alloscardovia criceti TaxID=356828 RepID=UPI00036CEC5B|nr:hypothetical protein [Alloscardovia criceti]
MKRSKLSASITILFVLAFSLVSLVTAPQAHAEEYLDTYTGWLDENGNKYWYDHGVRASSKEIYDPGSDAWYWIDADGTMARNKDVYVPSNGGKWVRYDFEGHMIKGEDYRYGGWYYFDNTTGAMSKGMKHISSNGGKWVYYDVVTGQMAHGERFINYDREHTGWYHFDEYTGAMSKGMRFVPSNGGKWVYYDVVTGQMAHGERFISYDDEHTGWYLFDGATGAMVHGDVYILSSGGKWVRYDRITGKMVHGPHFQDGAWYYFDHTTGAMAHGTVWVPDWGKEATFDSITGREVSGNSSNNSNNSGDNSTGGRRVRGQWCKPEQNGQRRLDTDGVPIICEYRNGNRMPHWYKQ